MKRLSVVLIIIGMLVASYPLMEQLYSWYWQHRLLSQWQEAGQAGTAAPPDLNILEDSQEKNDEHVPLTPQGEVIGILIIDSIDLKLPIIKGLNETNLKIGVAYLADTPSPAEDGNTVLAGHRGHSYGRLLNRLNEVEPDDKIIVSTKDGDYDYTVFNKVIVKPEDTDLLRSAKDAKILTIVTCDPVLRPTHRLIVQARPDR